MRSNGAMSNFRFLTVRELKFRNISVLEANDLVMKMELHKYLEPFGMVSCSCRQLSPGESFPHSSFCTLVIVMSSATVLWVYMCADKWRRQLYFWWFQKMPLVITEAIHYPISFFVGWTTKKKKWGFESILCSGISMNVDSEKQFTFIETSISVS